VAITTVAMFAAGVACLLCRLSNLVALEPHARRTSASSVLTPAVLFASTQQQPALVANSFCRGQEKPRLPTPESKSEVTANVYGILPEMEVIRCNG